jgi:NTE family protein
MPSGTVARMGGSSPRVGLALGAGGVAGGAFHAGVLAALAEATGWDPRTASIVVGTSAGSIAGASLRAGFPAADMLARAQDRPLSAEGEHVMRKVGPIGGPPPLRPVRTRRPRADVTATLARAARRPFAARPLALLASLMPEGSISTDMISEGMGGLFSDTWPADPLWICAVGQADGRRVVFGRDGDRPTVPDAVAASCAIPGFFSPVVIDGEGYIDGGVHSPTNADVLIDALPLDLVIISSPMSRQGRRPRLAADQPMRTWARALLDAEVLRLRRRRIPVLAFQPDEGVLSEMGLNAMDPRRRAAIAGEARESALRKLARADVADRLAALRR